jgi:PAS domain S-box-containing protein
MDFFRACHDSPRLFDTLLSCIRDVVLVANLQGKILFANAYVNEVFGHSPDEMEGKDLSFIFGPDDLDCLYPNLMHMAATNKPFEGELMLVDKHNRLFFAFMVLRTCQSPEQGDTAVVMMIRNIDRTKQLEKTLMETPYQDLIKLTDGIAHELRNPMVAIGGSVNRLHKLCQGGVDQARYFERIFTNLNRIEGIIKKVEFFAHLPKPFIQKRPLKELIEQAIKPYLPQIRNQGIDVETRLDDVLLHVDRDLFVTAISILIENALSALAPKGHLVITSTVQDNRCRVDVSDDGSGILAENLSYIFKPFFSTKSDGTGLDLAVLKRIVESHGGDVDVKSKPGEGATFSLRFPLERRRPFRVSLFEK